MESVFEEVPDRYALMPKVEEAFRTGLGFNVDARGGQASGIVDLLDSVFGNWHRQVLVQAALPAFDGVVEKLTAGALAADVGCGSGIALLEMAKAFPRSVFHGYDNSTAMLSAASENLAAAGVDNASFFNVDDQALPASERYDFVITFDCLHDMPYPDQMAAAIRTAIKPDGYGSSPISMASRRSRTTFATIRWRLAPTPGRSSTAWHRRCVRPTASDTGRSGCPSPR